MFGALLGYVSGALASGVRLLVWLLDQLKKYAKLSFLFAGWGFFLYASSFVLAFTVYHIVGLLVVIGSLVLMHSTLQIIVLAFVSVSGLVIAAYGSRIFPH